ncbi:uncharacterized protein A1O9_09267 [Exophiala aquamarina CBS 119918]|uniref:Major facilitator superfamily (MFS) profile domain-containing protein n=1 Tax=Exophiala aquamarina CBS 119918 TaxID=1182545 RepID=A0A072PH39_9EURO|nr:uncharacterized protein A1O9_09267 [Exophiala aquamarina CBS 119918]KEF54825.1 hypothetical protein A1O9_09267 [Exophiala aquamarina CBS 119918]
MNFSQVEKEQDVVEAHDAPPTTDVGEGSLSDKYKVDTVHTDEAMKVLAAYSGNQHWTAQEEKKVRTKIDRRLLPILVVTYALQYYDKTMISQAALFGLRKDLELTGNRYSMASAIFFLGFICGAYPASQLAQRYPIERVASSLVLLWGICFLLTAACFSWQSLYVQRFFLGFLEAGVSPIFMLMVGQFYKKDEQALRMGIWYAASGMITLVSPVLNYGLGHIEGSLSPWRYMYIVGGVVTTMWSAVVYFCMPPDPIRARGFHEREKYIAVARLRINNSGVRNTHFKKQHVLELCRDEKFWLIFAQAFLSMIASGPVNTFMPIIISGFGFNTLNSLLLTIPAGAVGGAIILFTTYTSYKFRNTRTIAILCCELLVIMASLLLWKLPRDAEGGLLFAVYLMTGYSGGWGVIMGLSIANSAGYTKRVVSSSAIHVGYCLGQFTAPLLFKPEDAPEYLPGFIAVLVTAAASASLNILYRFICIWQNKRRDQSGILEGYDHAYEDDVTDKKVSANQLRFHPPRDLQTTCKPTDFGATCRIRSLDTFTSHRGSTWKLRQVNM